MRLFFLLSIFTYFSSSLAMEVEKSSYQIDRLRYAEAQKFQLWCNANKANLQDSYYEWVRTGERGFKSWENYTCGTWTSIYSGKLTYNDAVAGFRGRLSGPEVDVVKTQAEVRKFAEWADRNFNVWHPSYTSWQNFHRQQAKGHQPADLSIDGYLNMKKEQILSGSYTFEQMIESFKNSKDH